MADERTFLMGKFPAVLPGDLRFARNHMWGRPLEDRVRFGFTSYAVRLMQDVYFLDWHVEVGDSIEVHQPIGHIETSKAVSDLFAPLTGQLLDINPALLDDPSGINADGYGEGWLFEMARDKDGKSGDTSTLMDVNGYYAFLEENWEKTQQVIKGKINTEE